MGAKAFGEQSPTFGEDPVSWQTWSDGDGGTPDVSGSVDWGKLLLDINDGEEGRSAVYNLGSSATRKFTLTENRYGSGSGSAVLEIRGDTSSFNQDADSPDWEIYSAPVSKTWQYVQIRLRTFEVYYMDATSGDDGNDGKSPAEAWETLAKVNGETFNPGDQILFKRGETFSGKLIPPSAGAPQRPIVFGAYGSGNRPIVDGSADSALLVETPVNHLRFESIDFSGSTLAGAHVARYYSNNGYFYDCIFRGALGDPWGNGFIAYTTDGSELYNITMDSCEAYGNHGSGMTIGSETGAGGPHDCLFTNCVSHDNGSSTSADHGIYVRHGVIVEECTCYDNLSGGIKVNCEGVQDSPYTPIVRNNICYGNRYGIIVNNIKSIIYNNLFYGSTYTAIQIGSDTDDCLIYFNTFANCTAGNALIEVSGNPDGAILKNNIFIQDHSIYDKGFLATVEPLTLEEVVAANTFDYNLYFHNALGDTHGFWDGGGNHTFAVWQALGIDTNSTLLTDDPDFVARYTDFHPADAGNLKAHGVAITGYETDQDGNTRADPPTQGCYEESSA